MGNASGKDQQPEQPEELFTGVRTSPALIRNLANAPDFRDTHHPHRHDDREHRSSSKDEHDAHEAAEQCKATSQGHLQDLDSRVQQALEKSSRVGKLLLKNEQEELQSISQFADDLIRGEYSLPNKEAPCSKQRERCLQCYTEHEQ
ncbi:hypothetical protein WJX84_003325, partial [Apatococcus fuscideae]